MESVSKKIVLLVIAALAVAYGCSNYRNIQLVDIKLQSIRLKSASKIEVYLNAYIDNPTSAEITITAISGTIFKDGSKFADITLKEATSIPKGTNVGVLLPLNVNLLDPLSLLAMGLNIKSWEENNFTGDIKVTVRQGALKKTIGQKNIPLNKYIKNISLK